MNRAQLFAISAALCNASVGVLSVGLFSEGLSPIEVAFYKCLIAFICLSLPLLFSVTLRRAVRQLRSELLLIALMALSGIFVLYFFETTAYHHSHIPAVVFTLLGSATVTTFIGSKLLLRTSLHRLQLIGFLSALIGLFLLYYGSGDKSQLNYGILLAVIAGIGYGLFFILGKMGTKPLVGIAMLWWLLALGTLFLGVLMPFVHPHLLSAHSLFTMTLLALLPTIGGFYFTTRALTLTSATEVQILGLLEPVFASLLALLLYHQWLSHLAMVGAFYIMLSIYLELLASRRRLLCRSDS
ncbi:MAG: DMT family transporter [Gammaproteobacteria bacterium]|nr:DMT family transporter [Gammaproteobacteria bacterium]